MNKEEILLVLLENIYIILWLFIFATSIVGKTPDKMVKYKQRIQKYNFNDEVDAQKAKAEKLQIEQKLIKYEKFWEKFVYFTCLLSCISIVVHYYFVEFILIKEIMVFPFFYTIAISILTVNSNIFSKLKKNILWIGAIIYWVFVYMYYFYGKSYFVDITMFTMTIIILIILRNYKYQNRIIIILFGFNLIYFNEQYFSSDKYITFYNILLSISTGIVASAIIMMFSDKERQAENQKTRNYHLENIGDSFIMLIETIFECIYVGDKSKHFDYIVYDEFKAEYERIVSDEWETVDKVFGDKICTSLNYCLEEINSLLKEKSFFEINNIIDPMEIIALQEFYYFSSKCIQFYGIPDTENYMKCIVNLFFKIEQLSEEIYEIKDGLNQIGKEKLTIHREIGTGKMVWSDGSKVTDKDFLEYIKNNNK